MYQNLESPKQLSSKTVPISSSSFRRNVLYIMNIVDDVTPGLGKARRSGREIGNGVFKILHTAYRLGQTESTAYLSHA